MVVNSASLTEKLLSAPGKSVSHPVPPSSRRLLVKYARQKLNEPSKFAGFAHFGGVRQKRPRPTQICCAAAAPAKNIAAMSDDRTMRLVIPGRVASASCAAAVVLSALSCSEST